MVLTAPGDCHTRVVWVGRAGYGQVFPSQAPPQQPKPVVRINLHKGNLLRVGLYSQQRPSGALRAAAAGWEEGCQSTQCTHRETSCPLSAGCPPDSVTPTGRINQLPWSLLWPSKGEHQCLKLPVSTAQLSVGCRCSVQGLETFQQPGALTRVRIAEKKIKANLSPPWQLNYFRNYEEEVTGFCPSVFVHRELLSIIIDYACIIFKLLPTLSHTWKPTSRSLKKKLTFTLLSMTCRTFCHGYYNAVTSMQLLISLTAKYERRVKSHWEVGGQLQHSSTPAAVSCATNPAKCQRETLQKGHPQGSATLNASQEPSYGFNLGKTTHITTLVPPATWFLPVTALLALLVLM